MYKYTPPAQVSETVWAVGSPLFFVWVFTIPIGLTLAAVGMSLRAEPRKAWLFVIVGVFIILSVIFPQTLGYHIVVFGVLGGLILVLFLVMLWYWGKRRITLEGPAKTAADFQLIGYIFFLVVAWYLCGLLGNPYAENPGLYFPEKVIEAGSLPQMYAYGTKISIYLVLGFLFTFPSQRKAAQAKE